MIQDVVETWPRCLHNRVHYRVASDPLYSLMREDDGTGQ
jgi:hypothetical protein